MHHRTVLTVGLMLAGAGLGARAAEPAPEELAWLKEHALAFKTAEAGRGFDDLRGLKELIGNARVVALGEGTHGTREFFQMKHRLVAYLASELGFTIFSIEANLPEAYRLNDYVLHGQGDPKELIAGMYFWTWNTEEVLAMVEWMRRFNESGQGRIEFTGFDMQTPDVAMQIVLDFLRRAEPDYAATAEVIYAAARKSQDTPSAGSFGVATGSFPVAAAAGKRIKYSGWIRTESVTRPFAGLWWRVDGEQGSLAFDNMQDRGITGTTPWKRYEIVLDVPKEAVNINFGALHGGDGTAWFDSLEVEIDGRPYAADKVADLSFETGAAGGFYTGGLGYQIKVVPAEPQAGQHCLEMRFVGSPASQSVDAGKAAEQCTAVLEHLKAGRQKYVGQGPEKDVEWAIQNARVVMQALRMRANLTQRDESMALNVRWIMEQADPQAKLVLWAHNGHIRKDGHFGWRPMGAHLKEKLGNDYLAVGFACRAGQYTAIKSGIGLQANDLQAPPPGSAEDYFHKTGLPRFIVDLRAASADKPAAAWLTRPVQFRAIGALAMDEQFGPITLPDAFDVLIYFDETTPSRLLGK